jgi:hypothetical protein
MSGEVGILNVGAGDTKLSFDPKNPVERIRAARIVKDMLRRGYVLLIRQEDGTHTRALDFDESTCEYIIADLDTTATEDPNAEVKGPAKRAPASTSGPAGESAPPAGSGSAPESGTTGPKKRGRPTKRVAAGGVSATAVARTAGG